MQNVSSLFVLTIGMRVFRVITQQFFLQLSVSNALSQPELQWNGKRFFSVYVEVGASSKERMMKFSRWVSFLFFFFLWQLLLFLD
jgi:hypothetical protein